jgi:general secretion pathway protein M
MLAGMTTRWAGLTDRERLLLSGAAICLLGAALFWGVWQPLSEGRAADLARAARYDRSLAALATMPASAVPVEDPRPLANIVTETAAAQGLTILRLDTPKPELATVTLQDAPFETLLLWIDGLNRDSGVTIASATLRASDGVGSVSADLVLTKGAP